MQAQQITPNLILCNTMLSGYARQGQWQSAKVFLAKMEPEYGLEPEIKSYR